jgi:hypothetical protein
VPKVLIACTVLGARACEVGLETWAARLETMSLIPRCVPAAERLEGIMKRIEAVNEKVAELASKDQVQIC